jgi:hypothetical protein
LGRGLDPDNEDFVMTLGPYIATSGGYIAAPPFAHRGAVLHGMLLQGAKSAQQSLIDATLNRRPGLRFEAVSSLVLLTAMYVDEVTSLDPLWADRGVTSEIDIGFWVLVKGGPPGADTLRWHPIGLFVDSAPALAIGREIYGFPKHLAKVQRAASPSNSDPAVTVTMDAFPKFGPQARPQPCVVVDIAVTGAAEAKAEDLSFTAAQLQQELSDALSGGVLPLSVLPPYFGMPQVYLKQFRDVTDPSLACYQAVTVADMRLEKLHGMGRLPGHLTVHVPRLDSINIGRDLGLSETSAPIGPAFWIGFDFIADAGAELG